MAVSGTITFNPTMADCTVNAFGRLLIRADQLTPQHLRDARFEANLLCQTWQQKGVNLWTVELQTLTTVQGTATYTLAAGTISLLDTYITAEGQDMVLPPVSRTDYASQPNKTQQGRPNMMWVNRQSPTPTMTLWPTPDAAYVISYYRLRQLYDVNLDSTGNPDVPLRFTDAFISDLSWRLSRLWRPDLEDKPKHEAMDSWNLASGDDVEEGIQMFISPSIGAYFP